MEKKLELCMFCGRDNSFGEMTKEHFVPKGLWDKERPNATLTVPAHKECNKRFSGDNEYFRDVLVTGTKCSEHPEVKKVLKGTMLRKIKKRRGYFLKNFLNLGVRPVYSEAGLYLGRAPMFDCNWQRIETVLKNVMKGIFYWCMEHPMPQNMKLEVGHIRDDADLLHLQPLVSNMCDWVGFGDDVFGCRFVFHSQDKYMHCLMKFYRSMCFYGKGVLPECVEVASP